MNNRGNIFVIAIVILLILIFGFGYNIFNFGSESSEITGNTINEGEGGMKTFVLEGANLRFYMNGVENPTISVKEGDMVRIEFKSTQGFHDWVLDEFDAQTERVGVDNGTTFVEFTADKKGIFEYYCSVGQHRENGMKGVFIVE